MRERGWTWKEVDGQGTVWRGKGGRGGDDRGGSGGEAGGAVDKQPRLAR